MLKNFKYRTKVGGSVLANIEVILKEDMLMYCENKLGKERIGVIFKDLSVGMMKNGLVDKSLEAVKEFISFSKEIVWHDEHQEVYIEMSQHIGNMVGRDVLVRKDVHYREFNPEKGIEEFENVFNIIYTSKYTYIMEILGKSYAAEIAGASEKLSHLNIVPIVNEMMSNYKDNYNLVNAGFSSDIDLFHYIEGVGVVALKMRPHNIRSELSAQKMMVPTTVIVFNKDEILRFANVRDDKYPQMKVDATEKMIERLQNMHLKNDSYFSLEYKKHVLKRCEDVFSEVYRTNPSFKDDCEKHVEDHGVLNWLDLPIIRDLIIDEGFLKYFSDNYDRENSYENVINRVRLALSYYYSISFKPYSGIIRDVSCIGLDSFLKITNVFKDSETKEPIPHSGMYIENIKKLKDTIGDENVIKMAEIIKEVHLTLKDIMLSENIEVNDPMSMNMIGFFKIAQYMIDDKYFDKVKSMIKEKDAMLDKKTVEIFYKSIETMIFEGTLFEEEKTSKEVLDVDQIRLLKSLERGIYREYD